MGKIWTVKSSFDVQKSVTITMANSGSVAEWRCLDVVAVERHEQVDAAGLPPP